VCIDSNSATFTFATFDKSELQQMIIDEKLVSAAVHGTHEPSAVLDSSFPADNAYRMYKLFFGSVAKCLTGKTHVLLATDADLFAVPWNALLTEPPSKDDEFRFRTAPWLPKSYALSLLPSVQSIYQLRTNLKPSRARQIFLGIGDPDFQGGHHPTQLALGPLFSSRGLANTSAIKDLPRLPESADELRAVARVVGASTEDLLLGRGATERALRQRPLNDYRVISFATHAIVAGEIEGVTEPALVLTPGPDDTNSQNDGLLTTSEIANLTLDANLIILSACNTAASDGHASGRGLSGLANAFFFAGARAVAVTQWAVFSSAARQLGAGLVSRSVNSSAIGVAEGLRETMVDYISSAKEDYLANPRFWGAFIIAGDGAVRPLDGISSNAIINDAINVEWEHMTDERGDAEIYSVTKNALEGSLYSIGLERPPPNEKRAGSYFARIQSNGTVSVLNRDHDLAASGVISLGHEIGLLGYTSVEGKSAAVFRLLNEDGRIRWQRTEKSPLWDFPISIIKADNDYILVSMESDYSPSPVESTLVITLVGADLGNTMSQRRYPLSIRPVLFSSKDVVVDIKGNVIVAIGGNTQGSPSAQRSPTWTNPKTGTKRYCAAPEATELLEFDANSLDVGARKIVDNVAVVSLKLSEGHLLAASRVGGNCRLEKRLNLAELGPEYEFKTIFESNNVNSLEVHDLEVTSDGIILLAGVTVTFLPTASTLAVRSAEEIIKSSFDFTDESIWEKTEQRGIAFVVALSKDGQVLGDRVFPDLRYRTISTLAVERSGRLMAVGGAFGGRGWVAELRLGGRLGQTAPRREFDYRKWFTKWSDLLGLR
jgi:CHAT domain-containing protein